MTWDGNLGNVASLNYHESAANAFPTALNLGIQLWAAGLTGENVILAHSLGNMVVSSAIQDWGLSVDKYFMLDAAVATESYDASTFNDSPSRNYMVNSAWAGYNANTWCSTWYQLFSAPDDRAKLTWQSRFPMVLPIAYNFYSSGDQCFETYPGTPSEFSGYYWHGGLDSLERYCWQKQEIFKGCGNLAGTTWAGWGFWEDDYGAKIPPNDANSASPDQLRTNPVFVRNPLAMFSSNIASGDVNNILCFGIPALSHAAGVNAIDGVIENFDDQAYQNGWGRNERPYKTRWLHNDLREMAYPYTYKVFNGIVSRGGLQ